MPGGRPTIMDEITLQKLETAYSNDASDEQACFLANIAPATLYNYQKEHPEFVERKRALKDMIKYQAKAVIKNALLDEKQGLDTAKWYLEKRDREFKPKQDITTDDKPLPILNVLPNISDNQNTEPKQED